MPDDQFPVKQFPEQTSAKSLKRRRTNSRVALNQKSVFPSQRKRRRTCLVSNLASGFTNGQRTIKYWSAKASPENVILSPSFSPAKHNEQK